MVWTYYQVSEIFFVHYLQLNILKICQQTQHFTE
jgi:hypothetical protein